MKTPFGTDVNSPEPQDRKRRWPLFAAIGLALSLLVGVSFAASISINTDTDIEFGQGDQPVTTCATTTEPNLTSGYDGDSFDVLSVTLTIPAGCAGRWIRIGLWDGTTVLDYLVFHATAAGSLGGASEITLDSAGLDCTTATSCGPASGLNYGLGPVDASLVNNFTVESFEGEPS